MSSLLLRFRMVILLLSCFLFILLSSSISVVTAAPAPAENNHKHPQKVPVQSFSDSVYDLMLNTRRRLKNLNLNHLRDNDRIKSKLKELIATNNAFVAARSHYDSSKRSTNKTNNNTKKKIVIVSDGSLEGLAAALLLSSTSQQEEHNNNLQVILLTPSASQTSHKYDKDDDFILLTSLGGLDWLFRHLPPSIVQRYLDTFVASSTGNEHLVALPIEPHPVVPATSFEGNKIMVEDEDENDNKSDTKRSSPLEFTPHVSSLLTPSSSSSSRMIGRGMSRHALEAFLWKELARLSKQNKIQIQPYTSLQSIQIKETNESNNLMICLTGTDENQGSADGKEFTIQDISLLIGADGANSQVRTLAARRLNNNNVWTKLFLLPLIYKKKKEFIYQTQTSNWSRKRIVALPMTASDVRAHLPPEAYLPRHEFYTFQSMNASKKRTGLCLLVPPEGNVQLIAHQKHDFWKSRRKLQSSTQIHITLCELFPQLSFGLFSPQVVQTIQEAHQTHSNKKNKKLIMKHDKHVHSNVLVTSPHSGLVLLGSAARSLMGDFDCSALNVALSELVDLKRLLLLLDDMTNMGTALKQFQSTWQRNTAALLRTSQLTSAPMHYGIPPQSLGESLAKTIYHWNTVIKGSLHNMMGTPLEWRHSKYQQHASSLMEGLSKVDLFSRVLWCLFLLFVILV